MRESLIRMIAVTWEICGGREVSDAALDTLVDALENYDPRAVGKALLRCQTECKGLISLADIVARIDDGRPGLEEAWAMIPSDEAHSVVWTDEMAEAYDVVKDMLGEPIAARMAFKEAYQRICSEARLEKRPIHWFLSPGTDESLKQRTMVDAVEKNRLTPGYAMELAPHLMEEPLRARGLLPGEDVPQLPPAQEHKRLPEPGVCPESGIEWVSPDEIREFADNFARRVALKEQKEREERAERKAIRGE